MPKIAVVGLDGLSMNYLVKLINHGAMPYTKHIVFKSRKFHLYAFPPSTPPSWSSIMTGVNPGKHGITDFIYVDRGTWSEKLVDASMLEHPRVHEMLAMLGLRSIVINPIPSYPIIPLNNTVQFSLNFFTPKITCYPPELTELLKSCIDFTAFKTISTGFDVECEIGIRRTESYLTLVETILNKMDWDLFWINIEYPDHLLHRTFNPKILHQETVPGEKRIFENIDKIVRALDSASDNLIIVSDHGFASYDKIIEVNTLLYEHGYIQATQRGLRDLWEMEGFHGYNISLVKKVKIVDHTNPIIRLLMKRPIKPFARLLKKAYEAITGKKVKIRFLDVDTIRSLAFIVSSTSFGIIVKERGIINKIIELLKQLEGVRNVYRREEIFNGPYINRLPEIYIEPDFDKGYYIGTNKVTGNIINYRKILNHHPLGVFIAKDWPYDHVNDDVLPNYIVASIIINLYKLPLPHTIDGKDLVERISRSRPRYTGLYITRWRVLKRIFGVSTRLKTRSS